MRFLGITETCDLGALYLRLVEANHEVRLWVSEPLAEGTLRGMAPRTADWRAELDWVRTGDGIIVFEAVSEGFGATQDALRGQGFRVIGGSALGDRLENDRAFAQGLLADLGLPIAETREFTSAAQADADLAARPRRVVLKYSGPDFASSDNYVGRFPDGGDVRALLAARGEAEARFILMDHVEGVETGVGAFFNGERFLRPACLDWEHKRFFAGDMGELTGEMGTVATFEGSGRIFERTLAKVEPLLRAHGHVGWVNLNTIINEDGIWPLEFTCRFGYPGFAVLDPLQDIGWAELLHGLAARSLDRLPVRPGFSVGIVVTTPPFPYSRKEVDEPIGLPILLPEPLEAEEARHIHLGETGLVNGRLATSGLYGWTTVVTGTGEDIATARRRAYDLAGRIVVPNGRYRLDIGDRLIAGDFRRLEAMGLIGDA